MSDIKHWVIQELRGTVYLHGPYKSDKAAENRQEKISGGEVHLFRSHSSDPAVVEDEFRASEVSSL